MREDILQFSMRWMETILFCIIMGAIAVVAFFIGEVLDEQD